MKKLLISIVIMTGCILFSSTINASEIEDNSAVYDLTDTFTQMYEFIDDDEGEVIIIIEKIPLSTRIGSGTYKVTKTLKGKWTIDFQVTINGKEQFTSATNLNAVSLSGSFTSTSLSHTTNSATCSFKRKVNTVSTNGNVKASISKGKLIVS